MSSLNERRRENYRQYLISYCTELMEAQAKNESIVPENSEEAYLMNVIHQISTEAGDRLDRKAA